LHWYKAGVKVIITFPPIKTMVQRHILAFACAFVVEVIGAAIIVTSRIVGKKFKIKRLVQSQHPSFANFIKCILYLFDRQKK
jgi:hypothetical protein